MNKFISHGDSPSWRSRELTRPRVAMLLFGVAMIACVGQRASAQHVDVLVQAVDGRLATGNADFDSGQWTLGRRVYPGEFGSIYSVNDPGFNALAVGSPSMPAGATALPGNTPLGWDFLPMKIDGALANLFYWDGLGGTEQDVDFGDLPGPDYRLELFGRNNIVGVDGSPIALPGDVINDTGADGSLHKHRFFFLDSGDQNATTTPADGIYLVSARMTMPGLDPSQPIYFVFGTPGSTFAALQAAETWATNRVDDLAPDFDADFNDDFVVEGADYLIWQRNLGATDALLTAGDADRDGVVGAGDLAIWQSEFGLSLESFPGATSAAPAIVAAHPVPEPNTLLLAIIAMAALRRSSFLA